MPPKADILIAIDTTGSMGASIAQAKTDANSIVLGVQGSVADTEFAIVDFKDASDGVANEYKVVKAMTSSASDVQNAINSLSAGGGGDAPEAHNLVFHNSYTPATGGLIGWRSGTKKLVVVISDAEPHGAASAGLSGCTDTTADPHGFNTATELAGMTAADRTLFMVRQTPTATALACYQTIAGRTGGLGVNGGTALGSQIVSLINGAFTAMTELHMEVTSATPSPAVPGWISFTPSSIAAAPTPSDQPFTVHVAVPAGTPSGSYDFDLKAVADGADIGHQTLTVNVPSADAPILVRAVGGAGGGISGRLHSTANTSQDVTFSYNPTTCGGATGTLPIGTVHVVLDANGDAQFVITFDSSHSLPTTGGFVSATATTNGVTSDPSPCVVVGPGNDSWPNALDITATGGNGASPNAPGYAIDSPGQSRWYKFAVTPGSQVMIDLSHLPADYDLVLFKDIGQAYNDLTSQSDLTKLSAEFAGQAFTGQAFTGQAFTGQAFTGQAFTADTFSGQAFTGQAFTGQAFTGQAFTGQAFTGQAFTGQAFTGQAFTGQAFTAQAFTGQAFTGQAFTGQAFTGQAFTPADFASAQTRSGLAVSATTGLGNEAIVENTWNETGFFYVRVTGRDGAFDPNQAFTLNVSKSGASCDGVHPSGTPGPGDAADTGVKTVILTDSSRIAGSPADKAALATKLGTFAARTEVGGVVVDVAGDPRIEELNAQVHAHAACPYAENLVASALKDIVDSYRANNDHLAYVVLVGGDGTIPFFRYADQAGLAPELGYIPPVDPTSPSEASLRLNYTLSQDAYGAGIQISQGANGFPVPDLAVGRLVENATDATTMLDAYLGTTDGVVAMPTSSLVTGYDFLEDAANAVQTDLAAGIGTGTHDLTTGIGTGAADTLISPNYTPPADGWTADDLKTAFLGSRHDISFLAGHFSAKSALAADFLTTMTTTDLAASPTNFVNSIVFSAGCHSGYNVVDADGVPANTDVLDWSQAFAQKGATFIGGTGYQYGDTDLVMYSEQIYASFARELLMGEGPVSVGQALIRAKQDYLRTTPSLQGIDQKALLEATLFGLPMLSVNLPSGRIPTSTDASAVTATDVTGGRGADLGLKSADLDVTGTLTHKTRTLQGSTKVEGVRTPFDVTTTYYEGPDGVSSKPYEPTLPLITKNVDVPGYTLRGIGFLGGSYDDSSVIPLSGGPATEFGVPHSPFTSSTFYPNHLANPNYFDALGGGDTRLMVTPAQHQSNGTADNTSTLRLYSDVNVRLFYSNRFASQDGFSPALAAAPGIYDVSASQNAPGTITVKAHVVGDPSAGVQDTWVTWTGFDHAWHSADLHQDPTDSTLWVGTIPVTDGHAASDVNFMLQAVNGVGLVGLNDNNGSYFSVAPTGPAAAATHLTLDPAPTDGVFDDTVTFSATLTSDTGPIADQSINFALGGQSVFGTTDGSGIATVSFHLAPTPPGDYSLQADHAANATYAHSSDQRPFTILTRTPDFGFDLSGLPPVTYGTAPFSFSVADKVSKPADDAGAVTFSLGSGSLGCSVTGGIVTIAGATTAQNLCIITASIAATARYNLATASDSFAIGQAGQTIDFAPLPGHTSLDPDFAVSATATSGLPVSFSAVGQCTVAGTLVHVTGTGLCTITAHQDGDTDFTAAAPVEQGFTIVNPIPTVTSVVPGSVGRGAISFPVTVFGTGFVLGANVTVSGTGVIVNSTTYVSSTQLTAVLSVSTSATLSTSSASTNRNVSVTNPGTAAGTCAGCLGINQGPYGLVAAPSQIGRGATNENIAIVGFNFVAGTWTPSSVEFTGTGIHIHSVTRSNSYLLILNISIDADAAMTARSFTVINPDGGRSTAVNAFTITAPPTVTSLSPNSRGQGATNENVVVTGTNFLSGTWATTSVGFGTGITVNSVTRVDSTHLKVNLSVAASAAPGARDVTVRNPDFGRTTLPGGFTVNVGPGTVSLNPASRGQGATNQVIVITGANFVTGTWTTSSVAFSGSGITVNSVTRSSDATHLAVNVSLSATAALGARNVTVHSPDGGTTSLANGFTVNVKPTITSLSPNSKARGTSDQIIVITGSGFVSGASVSFSGSGVTGAVTWTDANHLSVKVTVASGAATGYRNVTVTNPDQGTFTLSNGFRVS